MVKFTAKVIDIKKALILSGLAAGKTFNNIHSHSLFIVDGNFVSLYSTDEDKISKTFFPILEYENTEDQTPVFTADPRRIDKVLKDSNENDEIMFSYDQEKKTLKIFIHKNRKSYISFPSFNAEDFLDFRECLKNFDISVNLSANLLMSSLKFVSGFAPKKDNKKFSNIFIEKGVIVASDGSTKIGAFTSELFKDLPDLTIRKSMVPSILSFINKLDDCNLFLNTSDKFIILSSSDGLHYFGFRVSLITKPRIPFQLERPDTNGFNVNNNDLQNALNRLGITLWEDSGVQVTMKDHELMIETIIERESREIVPCEPINSNDFEFIIECKEFEKTLKMFSASNIDIYRVKNRAVIYSSANIQYENDEEEQITIPFTAIAVKTLGRII